MSSSILILQNVSKIFHSGKENAYTAIDDISLEIQEKEFVSVVGRSGSGKSTLMYLMSGLTKTSEGNVYIKNKNIIEFSEKEMSEFRNYNMGFIFQNFYLDKTLTAFENVMLPLLICEKERKKREIRVKELMDAVGLEKKMKNKVYELSGGEMQRVCIARALVCNPDIIFADEPTGNLDKSNGLQILELLKQMNQEGKTIVMVTHNENDIQYCNHIIELEDGRICKNEVRI